MKKQTEVIRRIIADRDKIRNEFKMFKEANTRFMNVLNSHINPHDFDLEELKKLYASGTLRKVGETLKPESEDYFFSDVVREAARKVSMFQQFEQLKCWRDNSMDEHFIFAHDLLMEQTSKVVQSLCIEKRCPFANECIHDIIEAVSFELNQGEHYELALDPHPMINKLKKAKKLVS